MQNHRTKLIALSVQNSLTDSDREIVATIYNEVATAPKSEMRTDCLEIITQRLWRM